MDKGLLSESKNLPSLDGSLFEEESSPAPAFESVESKEKFFFAYGSREGSDRGDGDIGQGFGEDEGGGKGGPLWKDSGESQGSGPGRGHGGLGDGSGLGKGNPHGGGSQKGSGLWGKLFSSGGGGGGAIPRYAVNPKPPYPDEAREKGYEGNVLLKVEVLPNGRVGQLEVKRTSGYEILDQSALLTVRQWRFIPARKGGEAIPFWVNIPIKFYLQ
jgi:TonB family protein